VSKFIREDVWKQGRPPEEETHLAFTEESGELVGFAVWKHRLLKVEDAADGTTRDYGTVIDIPSFGLDTRFKSEIDHDGGKLADRLYAYIEEVAREHGDSRDEMPIHLVVDDRNDRGHRFWLRLGFVQIGEVVLPHLTYRRMIRA
jgi:hypothetical protein